MSDLENELLGLAEDDPHSSRKRRPDSRSNPKSKAYVDDSDSGSEMDMDLESEEGDDPAPPPTKPAAVAFSKPRAIAKPVSKGVTNPYPLEGKYVDEDDRDRLDALPEIEREQELATRLEEMQKYKDSQQLDAMYRMAGMGGDEAGEESDDDEPNRKRRKHTSVSKEASRAMKDLKNKRKAKDERDARRAARRERRQRSASASSSPSEEDGEISYSQSQNQPYSSRANSPDTTPARRSPKRQDSQKDLDALPADTAELNSARLSRYEIVDMMFKDGFEAVAIGAYVRLMAAEPDEYGRPKYRIHRIESIDQGDANRRYNIEYKGKNIPETRVLMCSYGQSKRLFRIADVSNSNIEETEFNRFGLVNREDGVRPPKRSDLKRKHDAIKALRDRPMTSEEISRQVEARKRSNPGQQRHKITIEITNLITSRNLAERRNDTTAVEDMNRQIVALGGDPLTGELVTLDQNQAAQNVSDWDDARIQKINENNKRKVREQMEKAHQGSLARKRAEEAIVRARQAKEAKEAAEKAAKEAAEKAKAENEENAANAVDTVETPIVVPIVSSGPKKGETPQQYIARTVDLDLGDF